MRNNYLLMLKDIEIVEASRETIDDGKLQNRDLILLNFRPKIRWSCCERLFDEARCDDYRNKTSANLVLSFLYHTQY